METVLVIVIVKIVLLLEAMVEIIIVDDKSACMIYDEDVSGSKGGGDGEGNFSHDSRGDMVVMVVLEHCNSGVDNCNSGVDGNDSGEARGGDSLRCGIYNYGNEGRSK